MATIVTFLFLAFPNFFIDKDVPLLVAQLGDKSFKVREAAHKQLLKRNSYALAVSLRRIQSNDAEINQRKKKIVDAYWNSLIPQPSECPYIDSLSKSWGNYDGFVNKYHRAAAGIGNCSPRYEGDRYATWVMLQDFKAMEMPPFVIKLLLAYMQARTDQYDNRNKVVPKLPFPRPFWGLPPGFPPVFNIR